MHYGVDDIISKNNIRYDIDKQKFFDKITVYYPINELSSKFALDDLEQEIVLKFMRNQEHDFKNKIFLDFNDKNFKKVEDFKKENCYDVECLELFDEQRVYHQSKNSKRSYQEQDYVKRRTYGDKPYNQTLTFDGWYPSYRTYESLPFVADSHKNIKNVEDFITFYRECKQLFDEKIVYKKFARYIFDKNDLSFIAKHFNVYEIKVFLKILKITKNKTFLIKRKDGRYSSIPYPKTEQDKLRYFWNNY